MYDAQEIAFNGTTIPAAAATTTAPSNPGLDMGPSVEDETWKCIVKGLAGTTPTLSWKIQESTDGSTWVDASKSIAALAAAGDYQGFITIRSNARYRRASYTTTGTGLSGTIWIGPVQNGGEYNRF